MRRLFRFKYPKITLLIILSALAYWMFNNSSVLGFVDHLQGYSYLGVFIAGLLFSFGFTTPFAIGFFVVANPGNIYLAAVIGGFGALLSDLLIFKIIRFSFMKEFRRLEKTMAIREIKALLSSRFLSKIKLYLLYVFAGIVIASPLPDELGVTMLAGLSKISLRTLAIVSFIMNTVGILILLWI